MFSEYSSPFCSKNSTGSGTTFYDRIAGLSHQAFNTLAAGIPESISGRKVLAALIMKRSETDEGSVICLGTGKFEDQHGRGDTRKHKQT